MTIIKSLFSILITFSLTEVFSQSDDFAELLEKGKSEFKKEYDQQDYSVAADDLEKAVKLRPENAEAHYFLGYAYSRLNSKDGKSMVQSNLALTSRSSHEFETVNKLTPKYNGEKVVLDPYSKLSSEWGSMAMSYWHNNQPDSAVWAFKEGKRRGGFGDFYLSINRAVLDLCSRNSILISSGDNFTIQLWYLQIVEGYRNDVSVVDISLLNTSWYTKFLSKKGMVQFDLPQSVVDTMEYCRWKDSVVTIGNFSWTVKPSYQENYILRGDRVFLSMLKATGLKRDVFFTTAFIEESRLSLKDHLLPMILVDKLNVNDQPEQDHEKYKTEITRILSLISTVNINSQEEVNFIDNIRFDLLYHIAFAAGNRNKDRAKELLDLMDKYAGEKSFPYQNENSKEYADSVRGRI